MPNLSPEQSQTLFEEWQERDAAKRAKDRIKAVEALARAGTCAKDRIKVADFLARYAEEHGIPFHVAASPREN